MRARRPTPSCASSESGAVSAAARTASASFTSPVKRALRALWSDHSMTGLPPSSLAVKRGTRAAWGTERRTLLIAEMSWVTVSWVGPRLRREHEGPVRHDVEWARALVLELRACRRAGRVPDRADAVAS